MVSVFPTTSQKRALFDTGLTLIARIITLPFENSWYYQLAHSNESPASLKDTLHILSRLGFIWKGISASLWRSIDPIFTEYILRQLRGVPPQIQQIYTRLCSIVVMRIVTYPLEVITLRCIADQECKLFTGLTDCFFKSVKQLGFQAGLYPGFITILSRAILTSLLISGLQEFWDFMLNYFFRTSVFPGWQACHKLIAAVVSVATYPMEMSALQYASVVDQPLESPLHVLLTIIERHGISGTFAGAKVYAIQLIIRSMLKGALHKLLG